MRLTTRTKASQRFRAVALAAAVGLLAYAMQATTAPVASAGVCGGPGHWFCGAVNNQTSRTMSITRNLGEGKPGDCDVWNWAGGTDYFWRDAACTQEGWSNGRKGGNGTGDDVDAFSFNQQGYHERFYRLGRWHWRNRGVWTKIWNGQYADCKIDGGGAIWCTVVWQ